MGRDHVALDRECCDSLGAVVGQREPVAESGRHQRGAEPGCLECKDQTLGLRSRSGRGTLPRSGNRGRGLRGLGRGNHRHLEFHLRLTQGAAPSLPPQQARQAGQPCGPARKVGPPRGGILQRRSGRSGRGGCRESRRHSAGRWRGNLERNRAAARTRRGNRSRHSGPAWCAGRSRARCRPRGHRRAGRGGTGACGSGAGRRDRRWHRAGCRSRPRGRCTGVVRINRTSRARRGTGRRGRQLEIGDRLCLCSRGGKGQRACQN